MQIINALLARNPALTTMHIRSAHLQEKPLGVLVTLGQAIGLRELAETVPLCEGWVMQPFPPQLKLVVVPPLGNLQGTPDVCQKDMLAETSIW